MASILSLSALPLLSSSRPSSLPTKTPFLPPFTKTTPPRKHNYHSVQCSKSDSFLNLEPISKPAFLDFDLPCFDPHDSPRFDVIIIGAGPAGLRLAEQVSRNGIKVCCLDPSPLSMWPNNYGVWVDEFDGLGLDDCFDKTWPTACVYIDDHKTKYLDRAYGRINREKLKLKLLSDCAANNVKFHEAKASKVEHHELESSVSCDDGTELKADLIVDASGFASRFVEYDDKPGNTGIQVAHGILAQVESHPFDLDKMVLMDLRDLNHESKLGFPTFLYAMPLDKNLIYLEETCLVSRPVASYEEIKEMMSIRLRQLGIHVEAVIEEEKCLTPLGGPLPRVPQRVMAFGANAGMVHPATGYMVAQMMVLAPVVAQTIGECLGSTTRVRGSELHYRVWNSLWPVERICVREFNKLEMERFLKIDLNGMRMVFNNFFDRSPYYWHGALSQRLSFPELVSRHQYNVSK